MLHVDLLLNMGSQMLLVSCNWATQEQQEQLLQVVCVEEQDNGSSDVSARQHVCKLKLQHPSGTGNCTFSIRRTQHQQAQQQVCMCKGNNIRSSWLLQGVCGAKTPPANTSLEAQSVFCQLHLLMRAFLCVKTMNCLGTRHTIDL